MNKKYEKRVIVALDFDNKNNALKLVDKLDPERCRLKVGKEMFTLFGPTFIQELHAKKFEVFLDLKFHDIPTTVAKAVAAAADLGVWMVNLHASGGQKMMSLAKDALLPFKNDAPKLIAVTVLTSMNNEDLLSLGINRTVESQVLHLASLAKNSGMDGVVCSAIESMQIKNRCGDDFLLVTPGIRPKGSLSSDQVRIMTPNEAYKAGSDYLVIGRPITQAEDPILVLDEIYKSIGE